MSRKLVSFELTTKEVLYYSFLKITGKNIYDKPDHWPVDEYDDAEHKIVFEAVEALIEDVLEFAGILQNYLLQAIESTEPKEEFAHLFKKESLQFVIEGTAEYTSSGENCRFKIELNDGILTIQESENYIFFGSMYFVNYESFCATKTILCDDLSKLCSRDEFDGDCEYCVTHDKLYADEFPPYGKKIFADKYMKAGVVYSVEDTEAFAPIAKDKNTCGEELSKNESKDKKERLRSKLEEHRINREKEENHVKEIIFSIITGDKKKTIAEMQRENQELRGMSVQRIAGYLRRFVTSGELECMENIYYMLPETAERIRTEEKKRQEEQQRQEEEKKSQEKDIRRGYERARDTIKQVKAEKKQTETDIEKIQAEISEIETELEKQSKKLFLKDKSLIAKLNTDLSEKRVKLKETQEIKEQCDRQLKKEEDEFESKYITLIQEEEERKRKELATRYRNLAWMSSDKKAIAKQLLSVMSKTEWVTISELSEITFFKNQDISVVIRLMAEDGLVERITEKKKTVFRLSDTADIEEVLKRL